MGFCNNKIIKGSPNQVRISSRWRKLGRSIAAEETVSQAVLKQCYFSVTLKLETILTENNVKPLRLKTPEQSVILGEFIQNSMLHFNPTTWLLRIGCSFKCHTPFDPSLCFTDILNTHSDYISDKVLWHCGDKWKLCHYMKQTKIKQSVSKGTRDVRKYKNWLEMLLY